MSIHFPSVPATFINIPKTGTTSFKTWVRANVPDAVVLDDPNDRNQMMHLSLDEIKSKWPNFGTTFCIVRNPYDRLVSLFHHIGQFAEKNVADRRAGMQRYGLTVSKLEDELRILAIYKRGFEHWVNTVQFKRTGCSQLDALLNPPDEGQYKYLSNTVPDIVLKLENIHQDFTKIQDLLGCNVDFPHVNTSQHKHYRDYYNDNTRKIVSKWFEQDLEIFEYEF